MECSMDCLLECAMESLGERSMESWMESSVGFRWGVLPEYIWSCCWVSAGVVPAQLHSNIAFAEVWRGMLGQADVMFACAIESGRLCVPKSSVRARIFWASSLMWCDRRIRMALTGMALCPSLVALISVSGHVFSLVESLSCFTKSSVA